MVVALGGFLMGFDSAVINGAKTPEALGLATGAGQVCGSCQPLIEELCGQLPLSTPAWRPGKILLALSLIAFLLCSLTAAFPGMPMADWICISPRSQPWGRSIFSSR